MIAQQAAPPTPSDGFRPVVGDPAASQGSIPAPKLIGGAYGFIWLAVVVFLATLWRRSRDTKRELDELRRKLDKSTTETSSSAQAAGH
jgi:CcmD family protein